MGEHASVEKFVRKRADFTLADQTLLYFYTITPTSQSSLQHQHRFAITGLQNKIFFPILKASTYSISRDYAPALFFSKNRGSGVQPQKKKKNKRGKIWNSHSSSNRARELVSFPSENEQIFDLGTIQNMAPTNLIPWQHLEIFLGDAIKYIQEDAKVILLSENAINLTIGP